MITSGDFSLDEIDEGKHFIYCGVESEFVQSKVEFFLFFSKFKEHATTEYSCILGQTSIPILVLY